MCKFNKKQCEKCKKEFEPNHGNAKYCSEICYFESNISKNIFTNCWEWIAGIDSSKRGHANFNGKRKKAHLFALYLNGIELEPGMVCRHLCNNSLCCNPDHLKTGTHSENIIDRTIAGSVSAENNGNSLLSNEEAIFIYNSKSILDIDELKKKFNIGSHVVRNIWNGISYNFATNAPIIAKGRNYGQGENNPSAKLNNQQVFEISKQEGKISAYSLAKRYMVTPTTITNIWKGRSFSIITGKQKINRKRNKKEIFCIHCNKSLGFGKGAQKYCSINCAFWFNVQKTDNENCWEWKSSKNNQYGQIQFCGKKLQAHIYSFDLHNSHLIDERLNVEKDLVVSHACHNSICCNPYHLELITRKVNSEKNTGRKDISGENNKNAKINFHTAKLIVSKLKNQTPYLKIIKEIFQESGVEVSFEQITDIKRKKTWKMAWN